MSDAKGMSFRARMNNLAKSYGLRPQTVIQNYMFERGLPLPGQHQSQPHLLQ